MLIYISGYRTSIMTPNGFAKYAVKRLHLPARLGAALEGRLSRSRLVIMFCHWLERKAKERPPRDITSKIIEDDIFMMHNTLAIAIVPVVERYLAYVNGPDYAHDDARHDLSRDDWIATVEDILYAFKANADLSVSSDSARVSRGLNSFAIHYNKLKV